MNDLFSSIPEPVLRGGIGVAVVAIMVLWESLAPRRVRLRPRLERWLANGGLLIAGAVSVRLAIGVPALAVAAWAQTSGFGLLNALALPAWAAVVLSVIFLDLVIYWQHRAFHAVPLLWRLHRVHHSDVDLDASSALRFHPFEIAISAGTKALAVGLIGAPVVAVIVFEALLNGFALFNHANAGLPRWMEPVARALVVTPDMHRVHHSTRAEETNSNFGFQLSLWDRVFRTYRPEPFGGQADMTIGLAEFRAPADQRLWSLLVQPFRGTDPR